MIRISPWRKTRADPGLGFDPDPDPGPGPGPGPGPNHCKTQPICSKWLPWPVNVGTNQTRPLR